MSSEMMSDKKTNEPNGFAGATVNQEPRSESSAAQDHAAGNSCEKLDDQRSTNCGTTSTTNNKVTADSTSDIAQTTSCHTSGSLSGESTSGTRVGWQMRRAAASRCLQQPHKVFVFSTMLANKGAAAVLRGDYPSITAFHAVQPGTKKFLEKCATKRKRPYKKSHDKPCKKSTDSLEKSVGNGQNNSVPDTRTESLPPVPASNVSGFWPNNSRMTTCGRNASSADDIINSVVNSHSSPRSQDNTTCCAANSLQSLTQGVKIPNGNLTPQQRHHREDQLSAIADPRSVLFPSRTTERASSGETEQNVPDLSPDSMGFLCNSSLEDFSFGVDWNKIQSEILNMQNKEDELGDFEVPTLTPDLYEWTSLLSQNAPPPYQSFSTPTSVTVSLQYSSQSSPNDVTSTLSLPSPRHMSAVSSPGEYNRQYQSGNQRCGYLSEDKTTAGSAGNRSEPSTPMSYTNPFAYNPAEAPAFQIDSTMDFRSVQSPNVNDLLCQKLETVRREQHEQEANLMPKPSPQQTQYLHSSNGQKLSIQRLPNNGLNEKAYTIDVVAGHLGSKQLPNTPNLCSRNLEGSSPMSDNMELTCFGPKASPRPLMCSTPDDQLDLSMIIGTRTSVPYNQMLPPERVETRTASESSLPASAAPPITNEQRPLVTRRKGCGTNLICLERSSARRKPTIVSVRRPDSLALNLNTNAIASQLARRNTNANHSDPISSLAHMSHQIVTGTSNIGEVKMQPGNGVMTNPQAMPQERARGIHGSRVMDPKGANYGECYCPYPPMPPPNCQQPCCTNGAPARMNYAVYRPVNPASYAGQLRPTGNSAAKPNIQVKPGAPNTFQYLPTRENVNSVMPRGPPSLGYPQGYRTPASNLGPRIPTMPNPRYFNAGAQNHYMHGAYPGMGQPQRPVERTAMFPQPNAVRFVAPRPQGYPQQMCRAVRGPVNPGGLPNGRNARPQINRMYVLVNREFAQGIRLRPPQPGIPAIPGGDNSQPRPFGGGPPAASGPNYAYQYPSPQQQTYVAGTRYGAPTSQVNSQLPTISPTLLPDR